MDSVHWTQTHKRVKIEGKGNKFLAFKSSRDFLNCSNPCSKILEFLKREMKLGRQLLRVEMRA